MLFEQEAASVVRALRAAISEMLASLPGMIRKPADLHRALGIPPSLGWQVFRVAHAHDPLTAAVQIPKPRAMSRVLAAASQRGAAKGLIASVSTAFERFETFVAESAGDREAFDSIVSSATSAPEREQIDLQHRRSAFRAASHIWGVQADARLSCSILHPSSDPAHVDVAMIHGDIRFTRRRRDAMRIISRVRGRDNKGAMLSSHPVVPIDADAANDHGIPLLRGSSSEVLVKLETWLDADGFRVTTLADDSVGIASAVTCFFGEMFPNAATRARSEMTPFIKVRAGIRKPTAVLFNDMLVFEGLFGRIEPAAYVIGDLMRGLADDAERGSRQRLPQQVSVAYLGKGLGMLHTPEVPRYAEMVQFALDRLGWDGERFEVYRCRVEYPVMPSTVIVKFDLPEKTPT